MMHTPRTASHEANMLLLDREIAYREPVGATATRAALRNSRGESNNAVREVTLTLGLTDWGVTRLDAVGPTDSRPLIVRSHTGRPHIRVLSGHVILHLSSPTGSRVEIASGATATIFAERGRQITTVAEAGAVVHFYNEPGTWGVQTVQDGAQFLLHGAEGRLQILGDADRLANVRLIEAQRDVVPFATVGTLPGSADLFVTWADGSGTLLDGGSPERAALSTALSNASGATSAAAKLRELILETIKDFAEDAPEDLEAWAASYADAQAARG